jgi:rhodanese-related sulfurtransferase
MHETEKLDKNSNFYVYCRSGIRSVSACHILEQLGVNNTYNLSGGIMSWQGKLVAPK